MLAFKSCDGIGCKENLKYLLAVTHSESLFGSRTLYFKTEISSLNTVVIFSLIFPLSSSLTFDKSESFSIDNMGSFNHR